jgi:hypothetical protein
MAEIIKSLRIGVIGPTIDEAKEALEELYSNNNMDFLRIVSTKYHSSASMFDGTFFTTVNANIDKLNGLIYDQLLIVYNEDDREFIRTGITSDEWDMIGDSNE